MNKIFFHLVTQKTKTKEVCVRYFSLFLCKDPSEGYCNPLEENRSCEYMRLFYNAPEWYGSMMLPINIHPRMKNWIRSKPLTKNRVDLLKKQMVLQFFWPKIAILLTTPLHIIYKDNSYHVWIYLLHCMTILIRTDLSSSRLPLFGENFLRFGESITSHHFKQYPPYILTFY